MLKTITKIKVLSSNSFGGVNNIVLNIENLKKAYIWKPCDQKFWRITVYFSFDISSTNLIMRMNFLKLKKKQLHLLKKF